MAEEGVVREFAWKQTSQPPARACRRSPWSRFAELDRRARHGQKVTGVLIAPTGRAAKRLAELTRQEAFTVHRLLELQPGDPRFDRERPQAVDLAVVDKCSMMDVILANELINAIPEGAHLLLVGDVDQLPSVGAGEVLRDQFAAESIPQVRLTPIFRQAQQSGIVTNAHRINRGKPPQLTGYLDFYWFTCEPPEDSGAHPAEATATLIVDLVIRRIPTKFGLDLHRDIQVLAPMHRGPAGAGNLNTPLQDALTPSTRTRPRNATARGCSASATSHPATQQLHQGQSRRLQRHRRSHHRPLPARADAHRPHRQRRTHRLRLRRTRRTRPRRFLWRAARRADWSVVQRRTRRGR